MHAFLCAIDETVWDSVENGWVRPTTPKAEWDKVALALANANSKAINLIFCGVSTDEFHKISHVMTAKEVWTIPRLPTKEPRSLRTPNCKCSLPDLKK